MSIGTKKVKFRTLVIVTNIILVVLFQSVYVNMNIKRLKGYAQSAETEVFQTYHTYLCDAFSECMYEVDMLRSFIDRNRLNSYVSQYINLLEVEQVERETQEIAQKLENLSASGNIVRDFIIFGDNCNQKNLFADVKERKLNDDTVPTEDVLVKTGLDGVLHTNMGALVQCTNEQLEDVRTNNLTKEEKDRVSYLLQYLEEEYIVCDYLAHDLVLVRLNKEYVESKLMSKDSHKFVVYQAQNKPVLCFNTDEEYAKNLINELDFEKEYFENGEYHYNVTNHLYGDLNVFTEQKDTTGTFSFINSNYMYFIAIGIGVAISIICLYVFTSKVFRKISFLHTTIKKQTKSNSFDYMNVGKGHWKFSTRILMTFICSCTLSLLASSFLMNWTMEYEARGVVEKIGSQMAMNYANEYENHYERYESISTAKIEKFLQEFKTDDENSNVELIREFEENFYYQTTFLPGYMYAFITNNSGQVIYQTVLSSQQQVSEELIRNAVIEAEKLELFETQGVFVPVKDLLSSRQTLAFVKEIDYADAKTGTLVIVSDVPAPTANSGERAILTDFLITNKENEIIIGEAPSYNKKQIGRNEKIIYSINDSPKDYVGKSVVLTYYEFYVNQIRAIQYLNLVWSLIIATICVGITFLLRRILMKPFGILIESMNDTPEQGYQSIPEDFAVDEVDAIAVTYNKMMNRMEHLVEESIRKEAERSELEVLQAQTEFKMLQQQINPHFLFNTLECVNLLAIRSGERGISKIVQSLSQIMRYAISRETKVKVGREIQVLESYIEIQRFRFGDKISIELDVDKSLFELNMIKFILQPILENAISHGVGNLRDGGKIEIVLECYESGLEFKIKDNGVGMTEDRLQKLRKSLESETEETIQRMEGGIGLRNVYRRIALYYRGQGEFIVNSVEKEGTEVIVRLPFEGP